MVNSVTYIDRVRLNYQTLSVNTIRLIVSILLVIIVLDLLCVMRSQSRFLGTKFFPENFPSRASKTSHFPSHLIPEHSRLPTSRPVLVPKMKWEFPNLNYKYKFKTFPRIQYWTGNFLSRTEICYI